MCEYLWHPTVASSSTITPLPFASQVRGSTKIASLVRIKEVPGSSSISGVMGSSVRKVRIQGREGDEDRRLSLASQPFSEAVTQVSDGFPLFDRRLIEVSSSPGLWPDRLERFLQFEAVAFYYGTSVSQTG
jgi:hypothetical protein